MENTETTAAELLEQFEDLVLGGLSGQQVEAARGGMLRWLAARIEDYRSRSIEEQGRQIELYLPQEIKDKFTDKPSAERFELAATAFDEWRLRALDRRIYARAQAFYEKTGDMAEMKAGLAIVGDAKIEAAYFDGDLDGVKDALDADKGAGTFDEVVDAMKNEDYGRANITIKDGIPAPVPAPVPAP